MYFKKLILAASVIGLVILSVFSYYIYKMVLSPNTQFAENQVVIEIPTGSNFYDVVEKISPYLKDVSSFVKVAQQKGYNAKAGRYIILNGSNNNLIINTLRSKNTPVKVSFNNQERLPNLAKRISEQIEADSLSLMNAFLDADFLKEMQLTENEAISVFIPNSYEFYWNTSATQFRDKLVKEYHRFWNENRRQKAENQGLSIKEVAVLASIVQKETAQNSERPRVAGVYLNRLRKKMLLQADPTVIFAIKEQTKKYDTIIKRVLNRDLRINSPFNTYKFQGLPPYPITMPDISSVDAVLNPEKHDFYYFVADVKNIGFHKFSKTYAEHLINSREYHQWINKIGIKR